MVGDAMNLPNSLEPIFEIVDTLIMTASVRDAVPVSGSLIAPSGAAKSKLIKCYRGAMLHSTDSFTQIGLHDINKNDRDHKIRFLMVPDFNPTLSRKPSTVEATCAQLLSFTSDGTTRVDDGRETKEAKHPPVGIITGVTPEIYHRQEQKWLALGLRRRIIPIFYEYTESTRALLHKMVREDRINGAEFPPRTFPTVKPSSPAINSALSLALETLSIKLSYNLGKGRFRSKRDGKPRFWVQKVEEIDPHVTLVKLARAHALRDKRAMVNQADIDFVTRFVEFTDPERPAQI